MRITTTAASQSKKRTLNALLSAWLRTRHERGAEIIDISSQNLDELLATFPKYSVLDKQALLLRWLSGRSGFPGAAVEVEAKLDYPIAWCTNEDEFAYHIQSLERRGLVTASEPEFLESTATPIVVTPDGWTHLEEDEKPRSISDQAFVAMAFAQEMLPAWEDGIRRAASRAGYRPFRTDAQPSIERIDVQIMAEIRRSSFVIADVTLQRPGVYFEAGYALGLGIPVYWCVREDEKDKVHFDTRQYNHIVWSSPVDLEAKLFDFIYAISGPASAT